MKNTKLLLAAALSLALPGLGQAILGELKRGAMWLGGIMLIASGAYYLLRDVPLSYYSAFGFIAALLSARDAYLWPKRHETPEEPTILKP